MSSLAEQSYLRMHFQRCVGIKYGGVIGWDHCWAQYNASRIPSEKKLLLKAMGSASDIWLLQQ